MTMWLRFWDLPAFTKDKERSKPLLDFDPVEDIGDTRASALLHEAEHKLRMFRMYLTESSSSTSLFMPIPRKSLPGRKRSTMSIRFTLWLRKTQILHQTTQSPMLPMPCVSDHLVFSGSRQSALEQQPLADMVYRYATSKI